MLAGNRLRPALPLIALIAFLASAAAVTGQESRSMSRAEVVARALERAPDGASRQVIERSAARLSRAQPPINPEITVEVEGESQPFSDREYTRRVKLQQELDVRGVRSARRHFGTRAADVLGQEVRVREQEVMARTDDAISRWLVARRRAALLVPIRERARAIRGKAETARRRETITGFDARLLRSEALEREGDWLESRRDLEEAEAELRARLALGPESPLDVEDDLDTLRWACRTDSLIEVALRTRSDLARVRATEDLAEARVQVERRLAGVAPRLGISVARERAEFEGLSGEVLGSSGTFVGLELSVPLPLFPGNPAGIAEAGGELARAQAERAALETEVRQEIAAACAALERAEDRHAVAVDAAATASRDLESLEAAYVGGRIAIDQYLTLRDRLIRLQLDAIDTQGVLEEQRSRLVRATGMGRQELARTIGGVR